MALLLQVAETAIKKALIKSCLKAFTKTCKQKLLLKDLIKSYYLQLQLKDVIESCFNKSCETFILPEIKQQVELQLKKSKSEYSLNDI